MKTKPTQQEEKIEKINIRESQRDITYQVLDAKMASFIRLADKINEIIDYLNKEKA